MNKIFKIVFNAARGKMMVVNEATSSVQTGKKAAVTVAVIGALASGAAQALTIEGTPAANVYGNGELIISNQEIDGTSRALYAGAQGEGVDSAVTTISGSSFDKTNDTQWAIYGGSRSTDDIDGNTVVNISNSEGYLIIYGAGVEKGSEYESSSSKVVADNVDLKGSGTSSAVYRSQIFGGGKTGTSNVTMTFEKTEVSINNVYGGAVIDSEDVDPHAEVYGGGNIDVGHMGSKVIVKDALVTVDGANTSLRLVAGGSIVHGSGSDGILETLKTKVLVKNGYVQNVVGGNHLNFFGGVATLGSSEVLVEGGKVDLVVGGNQIDMGLNIDAEREASAESTKVIVSGGTIGTVVGGGYSHNSNTEDKDVKLSSSVKSASVSISNAEITGDVIGGGLGIGDGASGSTTESVSVSVENAKVAGTITTDNMTQVGEAVSIVNTEAENAQMALTNVEAGAVVASKGTVELRAEGKEGKTAVGTLSVEGATVSLTADGAANDAAGGDITKAIIISEGSAVGATVAMAEGMTQGAVTGSIGEDGKAVVTQATNSIMSNTLDLASAAPLAMNRLLMNDVRKRMGDLRAAEGTHGVWARYDGGKLSGVNGLENDFTTVQVGIDTVPVADAPRFGVAFAYTTSDADMKRGGAEMDAFSLAFYGTKFYDNGMFVDVIGRMATADTDVVVDGNKKGSMDNVALSLSGEFGWRFDVTDQFYVEPQAELTYTYVNADKLDLSGSVYEFDSVDSLMARVGFAAGFKCPSNFGDVYVRASAVHEFLGDSAVRGGSTIHEVDGEDTWVEFGIGANFNINKNTYVYADIERTEGAKLEEDWRANVGVRFAF